MAERKAPIIDRLQTKVVYEWLSAICCMSDEVADLVVGDNPVSWYASRTPANKILWRNINGDKSHGWDIRPVSFSQAAVLKTSTERLHAQQRYGRISYPAVAFAVGEATVAGFVQHGAAMEDGYTHVGLRVGHSDVRATLGLFSTSTRDFVTAIDGTAIEAQHVDVQSFAEKYPGVPLQ